MAENENVGKIGLDTELLVEGPIKTPEADLFGFVDAVRIASRFFLECPRPVLFAVYGRSGSGRTSFLRLLETDLKSQEQILQLHFSARPYRNSGNLRRALLRRLEHALEISDERFEAIKTTAAGAPDPATPEFDTWVDHTETLRDDLNDIIKSSLAAKGQSILLLAIDDLDLCAAAMKIQLIEFCAEFLDVDSVILLVTVDRKQLISDYLNSKVFVAERQASLYLERIFPHSYTIPWIGEDQLIDYVIDALERIDLMPFERTKKNRAYARFRRMVEVYLRRAAVTPVKIVRELVKFARIHTLATDGSVNIGHALFSLAVKSQFPEVYRFLLDKGERGLRDLKKVFDPEQDFSGAGFTVRYGRRLDRMLADTALRDLFVAYDANLEDWPTLEKYLGTAAFVPSPY